VCGYCTWCCGQCHISPTFHSRTADPIPYNVVSTLNTVIYIISLPTDHTHTQLPVHCNPTHRSDEAPSPGSRANPAQRRSVAALVASPRSRTHTPWECRLSVNGMNTRKAASSRVRYVVTQPIQDILCPWTLQSRLTPPLSPTSTIIGSSARWDALSSG
jgi:hypothetical protein